MHTFGWRCATAQTIGVAIVVVAMILFRRPDAFGTILVYSILYALFELLTFNFLRISDARLKFSKLNPFKEARSIFLNSIVRVALKRGHVMTELVIYTNDGKLFNTDIRLSKREIRKLLANMSMRHIDVNNSVVKRWKFMF